jgi:hypothetical protein
MKMASSSESRLTVTRCSPAALSALAFFCSREPLVVSVRSRPGIAASIAISCSILRRTSGSPPVSRIFSMPYSLKMRARRAISSKLSKALRSRNW